MKEPKVSIIVISYRRKLLAECIESIERQEYNNIEVLIHHTLAHPHTQMIETGKVNRLVDASVGEYISIICEDDEYEPTFVPKCVSAIVNEKVDMVFTDRAAIGNMMNYIPSRPFTRDEFTSTIGTPVPGTVLFSRPAWESVQGYTSRHYSDAHFLWKLCRDGLKAYHIKEPLFLYRIHLENHSNTTDHVANLKIYFKENPELMEKLNPTYSGLSLWQKDAVTKLLNHFYGDRVKWPKYAQLSLEPLKETQQSPEV